MMKMLKRMFQLTDMGTLGIVKASIASFFVYCSLMIPMTLLMVFIQNILELKENNISFFIVGNIIMVFIMYIIMSIEYNCLYNETYKESANIRIEIAEILKKLPLSFFSKHDVSDLSQTIMKDVSTIEHAISHAIPKALGLIVYLFLIVIMLLIFNFKLALCILIPIILSIVCIFISKKSQVNGNKKYYNVMREISEDFQESIELQQEIKSYNQIEKFSKKIIDDINYSEKVHIKSELGMVLPLSISTNIQNLTLGATILFGTSIYLKGEASLLYLIGYIMCASKIIDAVNSLLSNFAELMYLDGNLQRIKELRSTEIQSGEEKKLKKFDIEFKNVEFGYGENKVIDNISFIAKQGEVTAIVGPSGCGKTTVLRLMSRLYDYDKGKIIIDDNDIKEIDTESLFENISIVFQEVTLFNTSILENIRFGDKNATDEQVKEAARLANCEEFIEKLPEKYDTLIGENGSKLSGGERQRISIARAFLKNAPIILLDEISASLDVENEMKIQESLNKLIKNKTVLVVSHRMKSIENVNKIIVMENGKIESQGSHIELLEKSKVYKTMVSKSNLAENYSY
ncbi:ABC transporter ATP-binding protein [Parvimonas sp. G1641]|uniref:ABC transporter ATP-binding protein n=1 Tax=Parvimonas TaxID=543311 RepID=UPI001E29E1EA|nr:ABC transporter ATP-binding protein [uncultured Parvimonas sp.]MCE3019881.1 ABC transporter ATP-binding protein/permease [Parvimonas micra]